MRHKIRTAAVVGMAIVLALAAVAGSYWLGIQPQIRAGEADSGLFKATVSTTAEEAGAPASADYGGAATQGTVGPGTPERSDAGLPGDTIDRLVVVTASMDVRVDDLDASLEALRATVARNRGDIVELTAAGGQTPIAPVPLDSSGGDPEVAGPSSALVTIRVPAERLQAVRAAVSGLGTVVSESESASDVTEQAVDLGARLRNLRAEETRLRAFLARTDSVSDLLAVERELSRVRGEIESMDAQLTYLKRQAARATLTVSLSEPGPVVQPVNGGWGLREAITRGIQATAALVSTAIAVAIPMSFVAFVVLAIGYPVTMFVRNRRRAAGRPDTEQENATA